MSEWQIALQIELSDVVIPDLANIVSEYVPERATDDHDYKGITVWDASRAVCEILRKRTTYVQVSTEGHMASKKGGTTTGSDGTNTTMSTDV